MGKINKKILAAVLAAMMLAGCSSREAAETSSTVEKSSEETVISEEINHEDESEKSNEADEIDQQNSDEQPEEESNEDDENEPEETEDENDDDGNQDNEERPNGNARDGGHYDDYNEYVEPLIVSGILTQNFAQDNAPNFGNDVWYGLAKAFNEELHSIEGMDGNYHFTPETVEEIIAEHFDVTAEQIREANKGYSEEFGTYVEPDESDEYIPTYIITGAKEKDGTLVLIVDLYDSDDETFNTSVLTINLDENDDGEKTWEYISNSVIFSSKK